MKETKEKKYAFSSDGENYIGEFNTPEEAAKEYFAGSKNSETVHVSIMEQPTPPEECIDADDIIEQILVQDGYDSEFAEDWLTPSKEQCEELTTSVQKTIGEWFDKHGLRPTFFLCKQPVTFHREDFNL